MALANFILGILNRNAQANEAEKNRQYGMAQLFTKADLEEQAAEKASQRANKSYEEKKQVDLKYADQEATNAAKNAVFMHFANQGIPAEMLQQGSQIFDTARQKYLAEAQAATQKANTEKLGSEIKGEGLAKTRNADISSLVSQSNENMFRAGKSEEFARNNPKAVEAGMMGRELAPAAAIARNNTMSVGPGEYLKRLTSGSPMIDSFFGPLEGRGATQNEVTTMQDFGGMKIPTTSRVTSEGFIKPVFSGKLSALTGENAPAPTMPQTQAPAQVTPPRTMPGRSSGGKSMFRSDLPMEMQNAQPTKEDEKAEWVRKMLQKLYTEPKF